MTATATEVRVLLGDLQERMRRHRTTLVAAGVAFYGFLSLVPALIALVSVYGLLADPAEVRRQVDSLASALPDEVQAFLEFQLRAIVESDRAGVSLTLVVSLVVAVWSASSAIAALIAAIGLIHGRSEMRGFVARRGRALAATVAALVVVNVVVFLVAALPPLVDNWLGDVGTATVGVVRWFVLAGIMVVSIGTGYRLATSRRGRWLGIVTPGALVATALWLVASGLFSLYAANYADYARTYGSLAAIIVLMLWLWLSALVVLLGAEIDARNAGVRTGAR